MTETNMTQTGPEDGHPLTDMRPPSQTSLQTSNPITPTSAPETTQISSTLLTVPNAATTSSKPMEDSSNPISTDPASSTPPTEAVDPQITLTFLLLSGRRRTVAFPESTPVSRVKEIVWNTWPSDWQDEKPPAPGFLRLLHLGKIWMDDVRLIDMNLSGSPQYPTVVHLSVRPFLTPENDGASSAAKKRKSKRMSTIASDAHGGLGDTAPDGEAGGHSGCCCIIC